MIKFPSIEQFRTVISEVRYFYKDLEMPTLKFRGAVKLHGTNAGVCWSKGKGLWVQSRKNVITPEKDNAGFAKFVHKQKADFEKLLRAILSATEYSDNPDAKIALFGEWCGKGIQAGVAIAEVSPRLVVFGVSVTIPYSNPNPDLDMMEERIWLPLEASQDALHESPLSDVYHIANYPTWTIDIDFNKPQLSQNILAEITEEVERECPVGKAFGVSGIGEGVVWTGQLTVPGGATKNLRFKVKGEKHSVSKVKTLAPVDVEKVKSIQEFMDYAVTENRMAQGYDELITKKGLVPDTKQIGPFIKWVRDDVLKEESDTMKASGLEAKDISKALSIRAKAWFQKKMTLC